MRVLIFIYATFLAEPLNAATWQYVGEAGGHSYLFDQESVTAPDRGSVRAWVKIDFSRDRAEKANYSVSRWELRCLAHEARLTKLTRYTIDGRVLENSDMPYAPFSDVIPESIGQTIENKVCAQAGLR